MKYRIVKVETPERTRNIEAKIDFIPELYYVTRYEVEKKRFFFMPWVIATDHRFRTLEEAKIYVDWIKSKKIRTIIE